MTDFQVVMICIMVLLIPFSMSLANLFDSFAFYFSERGKELRIRRGAPVVDFPLRHFFGKLRKNK